jgi:hypothetical protein
MRGLTNTQEQATVKAAIFELFYFFPLNKSLAKTHFFNQNNFFYLFPKDLIFSKFRVYTLWVFTQSKSL